MPLRKLRLFWSLRLPRLSSVLLIILALAVLVPRSAAGAPDWRQAFQQRVEHILKGQSGTAVVLDVASGRMIAGFKPEVAARRLAPPGSTIKPFTLMALLDSGKLGGDTRLVCPIRLQLGGRKLDCSHPPNPDPFDARAALAWSCNNWFTQMAARLTPTELRTALLRAGLASPTGLAADEATGLLAEVRATPDVQLQAIGIAGIEVTPLEVAAAYRRLALFRGAGNKYKRYAPIFRGLEDSAAFGLAHAAQFSETLPAAGKTGTAGSGEGWTHAWFAGYWPADRPRIVVVVFIESGRGRAEAAPLARQIFQAYWQLRGRR